MTALEPRLIILDEDIGTDDAWALLMLLKAEQKHNLKLLAITCSGGNSSLDNVAINTIRVLEHAKRTDVNSFFFFNKFGDTKIYVFFF